VVHRTVQAHDGLILVDSTRTGTAFTVLLPAPGVTQEVV
jgi:nitrogen-specific signal transduction histidine kinase